MKIIILLTIFLTACAEIPEQDRIEFEEPSPCVYQPCGLNDYA